MEATLHRSEPFLEINFRSYSGKRGDLRKHNCVYLYLPNSPLNLPMVQTEFFLAVLRQTTPQAFSILSLQLRSCPSDKRTQLANYEDLLQGIIKFAVSQH